MRPRSAAIVACRVIALFLGTEALIQILSFLLLVRSLEGTSYFWATFGTRLVVAFALWIVADRLGDVMAGGLDDPAAAPRPIIEVQTIAFTVVGVVLAIQAIPSLVEIAASQTPAFDDYSPLRLTLSGRFIGDRGAAVAGEITRLALGIALILGARSIATALGRRDRSEPPTA